jgi:hypothetical protein
MTPATITAAAAIRLTSKLFNDLTFLPQSSDGQSRSLSHGMFEANAQNSANGANRLFPEAALTGAGRRGRLLRFHSSGTVAAPSG